MIVLTMSDGTVKEFNLKDQAREKALYDAWYAMHDDPSFKNKAFKITTDKGEALKVHPNQVTVVFKEAVLCEAEPVSREEGEKEGLEGFYDSYQKEREEQKRRNFDTFMGTLKKTMKRNTGSDETFNRFRDNFK